ncbi:hypothetical protein [Nocardia carnea]|uniref:hypothetical protein n=1 Tax=Nocardia carnea TaxID=37328 RepID=UPI002456F979|nr:hypothetical protein [Nocardia carnea]
MVDGSAAGVGSSSVPVMGGSRATVGGSVAGVGSSVPMMDGSGAATGDSGAMADGSVPVPADAGVVVGDIAAAVEGLVGQSLLTVVEVEGAGVRYRMLETVREFGEQELLAADTGPGSEIDLVETRMAGWARDFAVRMAESYGRGDELEPALTVAAELDNLVAVLRRAESAGDSATMYAVFPVAAMRWVMHGANLELMGWIPRMLAMAPPAGARGVYAELEMAGHAVIALHLAFMDGSLRHLAPVRIRARRLLRADTGLRAPLRFIGQLLTCPPDSFRLARLLARATRSPDRHTRSLALMARTNIWENMGRIHESSRDARAAVPNSAEKEVWSRAMLAQHRGSLAGQVARYRESVAFYEEAAELLHRIRAYEESLEVHSYLAASLAGSGEPARARRELATALGFSGSGAAGPAVIDDPGIQRNHRLSTIAAVLAGIELVEGDIDSGLGHFRRALELIGWPIHEATPGPGLLLTGAAALAAHVLYERDDVVVRLVPELVELAQQRFGYVLDLPQLGGVACAVGSGLLLLGEQRAAGVELLALAPRVVARQDYPVLRWDRHHDLWRDRIEAGRLDTAVAVAGGLRRAAAAERIVELVRAVGAHRPGPPSRPAAD